MKLKLISLAVLLCCAIANAKENALTKVYFNEEDNQGQFILTATNLCLGPSSKKRTEAALILLKGVPTNTYQDRQACIAAGGEIADEASNDEAMVDLLVGDDCELNTEADNNLTASTVAGFNSQKARLDKKKLTAQISCFFAKDKLNEVEEEKKSELIKQLAKLDDPATDEDQQLSAGRIISMFELGAMKLPDYSDGQNNGFSGTKAYFDSRIDGRFHFKDVGLVINTSFDASFYGSGTFSKPTEVEMQNGSEDTTMNADNQMESGDESFTPTNFNDVSDTLDAGFSLRFSADKCYHGEDYNWLTQLVTCISSSNDAHSSLGLTLDYGFINKDRKLEDEDTVNDYRAVGVEYRHFREKIAKNSNRIPDFIVSYQRAKFEEYGVERFTSNCTDSAGCFRPIQDVYRYLFKLNYRLITDKPYFIGFRLNAGPGPDEFGLTIGIRKSGKSMLDIFGISSD